jgi:hypothetical protein
MCTAGFGTSHRRGLVLLGWRKTDGKTGVKSPGDVFSSAVTVLVHVFIAQLFFDIGVPSGLVI